MFQRYRKLQFSSHFHLTREVERVKLQSGRFNALNQRRSPIDTPKIFDSEYRFCLILWGHEPVNSTRLVELCRQQLGWSKATTYTVIRRLAERGVLKNENATVTSLISKEQAQQAELDSMVEKTFEGSMPAFIAAFSRSKRLTRQEVEQLRSLIDSYGEE